MKRADVLYYHDLSGEDEFVDLCKILKDSRENDTREDHKLILKYIYNHLRKIFQTENAIQLTHNEDMSKVVLFVYDCLASELNEPVRCISTDTERYIEY